MVDIRETLSDRQQQHGDFEDHAKCTQSLKGIMRSFENWASMSDVQQEAIDMILHKLGRIAVGNPNWHDHWHDIAGYALLVTDWLEMHRELD